MKEEGRSVAGTSVEEKSKGDLGGGWVRELKSLGMGERELTGGEWPNPQ